MSALRNGNSDGFTLVEVLVAFAIVAPVLAALAGGAVMAARMQEELQRRTAAHWVALNRLAEIQLFESWPTPGSRTGKERCGGTECSWELHVGTTAHPDFRRIEVNVANAGTSVALERIFQRPSHLGSYSSPLAAP